MNILDENIPKNQRSILQSWRVLIRQIGYDVGRKGMTDDEIIPFLHSLRRPTFFTRDLFLRSQSMSCGILFGLYGRWEVRSSYFRASPAPAP